MTAERYSYSRTDTGELAVRDMAGGLLWQGLPGGRRVCEFLDAGDRCVVLGEKDRTKKNDHNLLCVDPQGAVVWCAETPDPSGPDSYVAARIEDGRVIANSWSCYIVVLDVRTGAILQAKFTK
jgi:hypothetical protein